MPKKKKKSTKKKASAPQGPHHSLPVGFWSQVWAVLLIVLAVLLVVTWFGVGGPVLEWINMAAQRTVGYAMYLLPILLLYIAVEIFRAEENRLPLVMKFAAVLEIVWLAGLFGLLKTPARPYAGGFMGDVANSGMSQMVEPVVAVFVYVVLIVITALFITRISPFALFSKLWSWMRKDRTEDEENVAMMKKAAAPTPTKNAAEVKLNAGVPMVAPEPDEPKNH